MKKTSLLFFIPLLWMIVNGIIMTVALWGFAPSIPVTILIGIIAIGFGIVFFRPQFSKSDFIIATITIATLLPVFIHATRSYVIEWDAVAMWMLKAKALYLSGTQSSVFHSSDFLYSSQPYPIGIPLIGAMLYTYVGFVNDQMFLLYLSLWYLMVVFVTLAGVRRALPHFSSITLWLVVMALFITPSYLRFSHNGYVDIAMALPIALCTYLFIFEKQRALLMVIAGFSLMIKNEGMALVVASVVSLFFSSRQPSSPLKKVFLTMCILFAFSGYLYWQLYTRMNGIPSFLDTQVFEPFRLKNITFQFFDTILATQNHGLIFAGIFFTLVVSCTALIIHKKWRSLRPLILPGVIFAAYCAIYIITPLDFIAQLSSSFDRLMLQLFPALTIATAKVLSDIIPS